ncbi:MAG TPA: hypothetical protein VH478_25700 [Trebonia sp.]|jgi:hypothetical protein|nr:hypothetical protein [Trebonia sp.]
MGLTMEAAERSLRARYPDAYVRREHDGVVIAIPSAGIHVAARSLDSLVAVWTVEVYGAVA